MVEMIFGNAMKAKPIPPETTSETGTPDACAINPKTEKMPIPAKKLKR